MSSFSLKKLFGSKKKKPQSSYTRILNDINTHALDGPFLALGLRAPDGKGVWLFGEHHHKENTASSDLPEGKFTAFDEIAARYADENILIFEGEMPGDRGFLFNAPEEIKEKVRKLLPEIDSEFTGEFENEDGEIEGPDPKTELEKLGYREFVSDEKNWSDPGFFEFLNEVGFYADVVQERFISKKGVVINIDRMLRRFLVSNFMEIGKEGFEGFDEDSILKVLNYWLEELTPSDVSIDETKYDKTLYTDESFKLLINTMRFVKHKFSGLYTQKVLSSVTSNLAPNLKKSPDGKLVLFKNIESMQTFAKSFVTSTMDLRVLELVKRHPKSGMISYTGAHHSVMFSALLQSSAGYVLEHSFVNDKADYVSGANSVENIPYDEKLDLLEYVEFVENTFKFE